MNAHCTSLENQSSTREIGNFAENLAKHYLEKQGLVCLYQQYRMPWSEIDLVMLDHDEVVFVEVRYRSNPYYGDPLETITRQKQKRLIKAALSFQQRFAWTNDFYLRIDVIGIFGDQLNNEITWIPSAVEVG